MKQAAKAGEASIATCSICRYCAWLLELFDCRIVRTQCHCTDITFCCFFFPDSTPNVEIISSPGTRTAGELLILTCTVIVATESLGQPTINWIDPDGGIISSGSNVVARPITQVSNSTYIRALEFNLQTSHGGEYTCEATSSAVTAVATEILTVQSEFNTLASRNQSCETYIIIIIVKVLKKVFYSVLTSVHLYLLKVVTCQEHYLMHLKCMLSLILPLFIIRTIANSVGPRTG